MTSTAIRGAITGPTRLINAVTRALADYSAPVGGATEVRKDGDDLTKPEQAQFVMNLNMKPQDSSKLRFVEAGAVAFLRKHFDLLNAGDLESAKAQLFFPSTMNRRPLDVYVHAMSALSPFNVVTLSVTKVDDGKKTPQGFRVSVKVDVTVHCSVGVRSSDFAIWWFPERKAYLIATRPTEWVLEQVRGQTEKT